MKPKKNSLHQQQKYMQYMPSFWSLLHRKMVLELVYWCFDKQEVLCLFQFLIFSSLWKRGKVLWENGANHDFQEHHTYNTRSLVDKDKSITCGDAKCNIVFTRFTTFKLAPALLKAQLKRRTIWESKIARWHVHYPIMCFNFTDFF